MAPADDAVARGLADAKVYAFASVDYPGAAESLVFDTDGTTAVGAFAFDPGSNSPLTAFTFIGGIYQILTVPGSTFSIATGINATATTASATPTGPSAPWMSQEPPAPNCHASRTVARLWAFTPMR